MHFTSISVCLLAGVTAVVAVPLDGSTLHRLSGRGVKYQ
jgi:hypothetical protein